ncbi:MAG: CBS domain-containing protein [Phycisphaerae bacterium]
MTKPISTLIKRKWQVSKIEASVSVAEAARIMRDHNFGSLLVVDTNGQLAGIVTERDILGKVVATLADPSETDVAAIMTRDVITVKPDTPIDEVQDLMSSGHVRHVPVLADGLPMGMISARDLMEHKLKVTETVAREQAEVLHVLEDNYPGITRVKRDPVSGRIMI